MTNSPTNLLKFLHETMSMTEVYQPVIIRELINNGGALTKDKLAKAISEFDASVLTYYKRILMRWPKATLTKHRVIEYHRESKVFRLCSYPEDLRMREEVLRVCEKKIAEWVERSRSASDTSVTSSVRYLVLK